MLRHWLRGFAAAVIAAVALGGPAPAAAVTRVAACADLTKAGETYVLTADVSSGPGLVCFRVLADRITLDLAGHTITGPGPGDTGGEFGSIGISDGNEAHTLTVVKNGTVTNFQFGIWFNAITRSTIRAVTASDNGLGMVIGMNSLVKDCIVQRNLSDGIFSSDGVQVEGCLLGGNGGFGLYGQQRMLVTRNTASGNSSGILVDISSSVTNNRTFDNEFQGIVVGQKSLVTHNTTNRNGQYGVYALCPSTVTYNQASDNGYLNFNFIDAGCFDKGNTSPALQ